MAACVSTLLGDKIPEDDFGTFNSVPPLKRWLLAKKYIFKQSINTNSAVASIQATVKAHAKYWKYLIPPPEPIVVVEKAPAEDVSLDLSKLSISGVHTVFIFNDQILFQFV